MALATLAMFVAGVSLYVTGCNPALQPRMLQCIRDDTAMGTAFAYAAEPAANASSYTASVEFTLDSAGTCSVSTGDGFPTESAAWEAAKATCGIGDTRLLLVRAPAVCDFPGHDHNVVAGLVLMAAAVVCGIAMTVVQCLQSSSRQNARNYYLL
jgi:hypothetical protein